jgi:hypothetical protein
MRPLSQVAKDVVRWFGYRLDASEREQLMGDLDNATSEIVEPDGSAIRFDLNGYTHPPYGGERRLPIDAVVLDADGCALSVVLSLDENDRLYELRLIRYEHGDVIDPDWTTLRLLRPDEVIDLGLSRPRVRRWPRQD